MPIEFRCHQCQRLLRVPDEHAGAKARCPQCSTIATVPGGSSTPPEPAAEPPPARPQPTPWSLPTPPESSSAGSSNPFAERPEYSRQADNPYASPYAEGYQPHYSTYESARSKIMAPAVILLIFGILSLMGLAFMLIGSIGLIVDGDDDGIPMLVIFTMAALMQVLVVIGSLRMMSLKNYGLAITSAILSLVCGTCSWLAVPFAIWALVVLCDSEVKRHFT